jgi:hypothetical protein
MYQLHDAEIAMRLLHHLTRAFGCPDAVYLAGPDRIPGGFDASIFGFTLDRAPPPLVGPLTQPRKAAICHGDFHPLNILADKNQPTGVIDWANAVIAEPAMDVGSAIANISAVPLEGDRDRGKPWWRQRSDRPVGLRQQTRTGARRVDQGIEAPASSGSVRWPREEIRRGQDSPRSRMRSKPWWVLR